MKYQLTPNKPRPLSAVVAGFQRRDWRWRGVRKNVKTMTARDKG